MTELVVRDLAVMIDQRPIIQHVSVRLGGGEIVGIIGPNGAGKSTLLKAICHLVSASEGQVTMDGRDLGEMPPAALAKLIAYLPQRHLLHWDMTVAQTVSLGRLPHIAGMNRIGTADQAAIAGAMDSAEVASLASRKVGSLSGGELGRAMLARALAVEAPVLLADEPVAALDPYHALHIMALLRNFARQGRSVLVVLHDLTLALRFCDRLLLLSAGRVAADGAPQDVLTPRQLETAYRVAAVYGDHAGEPYVVPWTALPGTGPAA